MFDMFKKKETISAIIEKYKTDPEGAIKYIDQLRASKGHKYDDKLLSDLKTILEVSINIGYRQGMKR